MRTHLLSDPLDPYGDLGSGNSDVNFAFSPLGFAPGPGNGTGTTSGTSPQPVAPTLPDESVEAMAAVSGSGGGGTGAVVAETSSSGFTINLIFDAAAMAAPASFRTGIEQAASILSATITNKITVNIDIDYSGTGGGAAAGPDNGEFVSYSTVRADLIANAAPGDTSFNALPTGSTIQGQSQVAVWNAQLKLFGLISPNSTTTDDGSATFATDINSNLLVGVALHELTHAMGRVPYGSEPDIFDFYRFTSPGARLFTDNIPASSAYFSLDGGNTKLADFGVSSDPSDFLNAPNSNLTPNDAFDEFYSNNTLQSLTPIDLEMLDALGFNTTPLGLVVVANAVEALQGGAAVSLLSTAPNINDPGSATLSSATIKIMNAGGNVVAGDELFVNGIQNGSLGNGVTASWNATTDTLTLSGTASIAVYDTLLSEVTFQDTGTDASSGSHPVRTVTWTINDGTNSYNATSTIDIDRKPVAANNTATDVVGTTFSTTAASGVLANASDLDGDSLTVTAVSDTAHGAGTVGTLLAGTYGHLTLNANGSYSYVADNTAAINSGPTGSHLQNAFTYTVSDGEGGTANASLTITLDRAPAVTAANVTLSAGHTTVVASSLFSVTDPDGNAIAAYAFEDTGSGHFVLNGVVEANNQEIDVTAAQLSQLTYQGVAGSKVDTVEVRVNDGTLWSSWTSFTVTPPSLVIESLGVTALLQSGSDYFLNPVSSGSTITGPELMFNGTPVTAGEWAGWAPVGAEHTSSGYDVAFYNASTGLFNIWSTDTNGNYLTNLASGITANSATLENFETIFNQDLNGDGTIGPPPPPPPTVIEAHGVTALLQSGSDYFLNPVSSGSTITGPELMFNGTPVTAGEWAGWAPVGAEHTSSGYDVAFYNASTGLFNIWSTDTNGNYLTNLASGITANSATLENFETIFNQDLNGDGTIGPPPPPPPTVIEAHGVTALLQSGSDYFLNPVSSGSTITGPELMFNGTPVTAGEWAGWAPVGAEHTSSGYDVAFYNASTGLFNIWSTDTNGNYLTNLASGITANSATLENFETIFNQDLNGDGTIGPPPPPPPTVIEAHGVTALLQSGSDYFLNPVSSGSTITGPELMFNGTPVTAGEWAGWAPVGAEHTSSGYDVAFYNASTGLFNIWSTDTNGNYLTNLASGITANSATLENFETIFNQDLNGDGTIGPPPPPPPTVIEAHGVTALLQSGSDYFLNPVSSGSTITGPELMFNGTPVTAGEWAGWAPVGAEHTSSGYDVAFYNASTGLFNIWSTDTNGNYLTNLASGITANSATLENFETIFNQDLNGDGTIGIYAATGTTLQVTSALPSAVGTATIAAGATLELGTADTASITFSSSTGMLKLDSLTAFTGVIDNFTGNGSLSGSDQIDLKGINFSSVHDSYSNGVLTITDGTNTSSLDFNGTYTLANFKFASDGSGGTIVYDPPVPAQPQSPSATGQTPGGNTTEFFASAGQDSFVFAQALDNHSAKGLNPMANAGHNSPAASWDTTAFLSDSQDGTHRHALVADSAHDAMPAYQLTEAQFHAHLGDFHIV